MLSLESLGVAVSLLGIWLTARRVMLCWPVNLVACALYFKLFYDVRLYADMVLQALFGLAIIYGWIVWRRGQGGDGRVVVRALSLPLAMAGLLAGACGAVLIGWLTSHYTNASLPWMDATLSSFSLVAQVWSARRHAANWLLWVVVDVLYVGMFLIKGLWQTAGLYGLFVVLAIVGYRQWRKAELTPAV
jgi:nicotinamide mononucleotide transporter